VRAPWVAQDAPVDRALEAALREALGDADDRATLAARWAQEASFEHGSVRSFDEALAALEALAAPGDIVAETRRARDDEVGHAQALFGLASALAGVALGPGPLALAPAAIPSRAEFARALFVEACVNETLAVSQAQAALTDPAIAPPIAAILASIVQDECAHVELAWRTLAWCLRSGDEAVYAAVADELAAFESTLEVAGAPWDDLSPSLGSRGGLLPLRARNRVRALSAREIIVPCARALLERAPDDAHIPLRASV
jgi:hypothetical protein